MRTKLCRIRPVGSLALALGMLVGGTAQAQLITVSAKPVKAWTATTRELVKQVLPDELSKPILEGLDQASDKFLKGVDQNRSFGAFADLPSDNPNPFLAICIPVTDGEAFLNSLKDLGLGVDAKPDSKTFTHSITLPNGTTKLYVYPGGSYLFVSPFVLPQERFKKLDPSEFDKMRPKNSELTISARIDRIPEAFKTQFFVGFEANTDQLKDRKPDEPEAQFIGRIAGQEMTKKFITALVKDGKELAIDLSLDPKAGPIGVEVRLSANPGSGLARSIAHFGSQKSVFDSLGSDSIMDVYGVLPMPEDLKNAIPKLLELDKKQRLEKAANDAEKASITRLMGLVQTALVADSYDLITAIRGPYKGKDGGKETHAVIFGMKVKDPRALEQALRDEKAKGGMNYDVAKSNDGKYSIHSLKAPQGSMNPAADQILGKPTIHLAILKETVLLAVGEQSLTALKEAIDLVSKPQAQGDEEVQVEGTIDMGRVMAFSQLPNERAMGEKAAKEVFAGVAPRKRYLNVTMKGEKDTFRLKVSGDVVVVKFFFSLGMLMQGAPMP